MHRALAVLAVLLAACTSPAAAPAADAVYAADGVADLDVAADMDVSTEVSSCPAGVGLPAPATAGAFAGVTPDACAAVPALDWLGIDRTYTPLRTQPQSTLSFVQDKNWYLLTLLQKVPAYAQALTDDAQVHALAVKREGLLRNAAGKCDADPGCFGTQVAWAPQEITQTAALVADVLVKTDIVKLHLRPSGRFAHHAALADRELLVAALTDTLTTLQNVYDSYERNRQGIQGILQSVADMHPQPLQFFEPLLFASLDGLQAAKRDEAGRYELLAEGENKAALAQIPCVDWSQYRFSVVFALGWGPDNLNTPLSELGQQHCDAVAERWKAGLAPFILLSGGHVHPDKTPYAEALEMKKYLMAHHQIPESAIIVDPHARHTTTNLRNVSRLLLAYGVPPEKVGLIASDTLQTFYVQHLDVRCNDELGYLPYRIVAPIDDNDACFMVAAESFWQDARDERDP